MLYTGRGDDGTTKTLHSDLPRQPAGQRLSKSSAVAEALGAVDELNSWLGLCRAELTNLCSDLLTVQHNLFIIQAELAGAEQTIAVGKVREMEQAIDAIEKRLPPIKSFFLPGASAAGAKLDVARTIARRAERRAVAAAEAGLKLGEHSKAYLNRLSSLLYAWARLANHEAGADEEPPHYQ